MKMMQFRLDVPSRDSCGHEYNLGPFWFCSAACRERFMQSQYGEDYQTGNKAYSYEEGEVGDGINCCDRCEHCPRFVPKEKKVT